MSFKIGLGILLPDNLTNSVRALELAIAGMTHNFEGLTQPPHITVKRPFEVDSIQELNKFVHRLNSHAMPKVDPLSYSGVDSFGGGTCYLAVARNSSLNMLHQSILTFCESFDIKPDEFEGNKVLFHTTVAMQLSDPQLNKAITLARDSGPISFNSVFEPTQIGVFMQLPKYGSWIIVDSLPLVKAL